MDDGCTVTRVEEGSGRNIQYIVVVKCSHNVYQKSGNPLSVSVIYYIAASSNKFLLQQNTSTVQY